MELKRTCPPRVPAAIQRQVRAKLLARVVQRSDMFGAHIRRRYFPVYRTHSSAANHLDNAVVTKLEPDQRVLDEDVIRHGKLSIPATE